jgi:cellulose synthase/poly-beta-1,6-N-acetylglucosamine synthase-like glycosyltransferase
MRKEKTPQKTVFSMKHTFTKQFRVAYLAFLVPFILAFLSWAYFPTVAQWIVTNVFRYIATEQPANAVWLGTISFFYTWYTFLAIGVAGTWITAAMLARKKQVETKHPFYPNVSFIVPAYNQQSNITRCITSLYNGLDNYKGMCEIIVVDDGSTDLTYEVAWATIQANCSAHPRVRGKVVRHMVNLGKIEALKTGLDKSLGQVIAIVDSDSEWMPDTLVKLADSMLSNGKKAVTGYIHPKTNEAKRGFFAAMQQLEYSQGLAIDRCAQSLGNCVLVVPGPIGVYDASLLRKILAEANIRSVAEDSEITLEMHKRGGKVGYLSEACSDTMAPGDLRSLWHQRLRWFTGWLHNMDIHADLLRRRSWLSVLLWYGYVFEYVGTFVDLAAVLAFPLLFWFAPDRVHFAYNLLVFVLYGLLVGVVNQAIALRFAYGSYGYGWLLFYTPVYPFFWLVNVFARVRSVLIYVSGGNGKWHLSEA